MPQDNVVEKTDSLVAEILLEEKAARDSFKAFKMDFYKKNSVYAKAVKEIQAHVWRLKPTDANILLRCNKEFEFGTEAKIVFENFLLNYRKTIPLKHKKALEDFERRVSGLELLTVEIVEKACLFDNLLKGIMFPSLFAVEKNGLRREIPALWGKLRSLYLYAYTDTTVMTGIVETEEPSYSEETPK